MAWAEKYRTYNREFNRRKRATPEGRLKFCLAVIKNRTGHTLEMTPADYERLLQLQDNRCAICGRHQSEFKNHLAIDHDHLTQKVRGLLCAGCNRSLGIYESWKFKNQADSYLGRFHGK